VATPIFKAEHKHTFSKLIGQPSFSSACPSTQVHGCIPPMCMHIPPHTCMPPALHMHACPSIQVHRCMPPMCMHVPPHACMPPALHMHARPSIQPTHPGTAVVASAALLPPAAALPCCSRRCCCSAFLLLLLLASEILGCSLAPCLNKLGLWTCDMHIPSLQAAF